MEERATSYMRGAGENLARAAEGIARAGADLLEQIPRTDKTSLCVVKEAYYDEYTKEQRKKECDRIKSRYPDRIPVICERAFGSTVSQIDKRKFLVPHDLTVGQFLYVIRGRMQLRPDEALFVFVDGSLPRTASSMQQLYEEHKSEDGFLYLVYNGENVFGSTPLQK